MSLYQAPDLACWQGRIDSSTLFDAFRWHQWVKPLNLEETDPLSPTAAQVPPYAADTPPYTANTPPYAANTPPYAADTPPTVVKVAFLGFCCDEGIRLNRGRSGASDGPDSIRKALSSLPCDFTKELLLFDAGNILCDEVPLKESQEALANAVAKLKALGCFPIVLGGGHELAYGTWSGLNRHLVKEKASAPLKIVNFDAHFDLRPYVSDADHIATGPSSGTMFRQIADDCKAQGQKFDYLCLGVQKRGNTIDLFKTATQLGTDYWLAVDMVNEPLALLSEQLEEKIQDAEHLYVTLCTDVIASSFAPGVSAPQPLGLHPEMVTQLIKQLIRSGKAEGFDIAEVSPRFDHDNVTASLASTVIFAVVNELAEVNGVAVSI